MSDIEDVNTGDLRRLAGLPAARDYHVGYRIKKDSSEDEQIYKNRYDDLIKSIENNLEQCKKSNTTSSYTGKSVHDSDYIRDNIIMYITTDTKSNIEELEVLQINTTNTAYYP